MASYAKVVVEGSPITKSNFKLHNANGRAILPSNSGNYHDRYALYEQEIAYIARSQNPDVIIDESVIAVLKVYYKSEKRHPDTINIPKSIFDGIENSGLIVNDAQITKIYIEEYYDKENPRFELELFGESKYSVNFVIEKNANPKDKRIYNPIRKTSTIKSMKNESNSIQDSTINYCSICKKAITTNDYVKADKGKTLICKDCFKKLF